MLIEVKQNHIDNGNSDVDACPIALAIHGALKQNCYCVRVYDNILTLDGNYYDLPQTLQDFVFDFDAGLEVKPFSFDLNTNQREIKCTAQ